METNEFLKLSQQDVAALLCCQRIPMEERDIFESACRWAEYSCSETGLESTGENIREALGPCLFEIRFPIMSYSDFAKAGRYKSNLLTAHEKLAIFEFIALDEDEKLEFDNTYIVFKTHPRRFARSKCQLSTLSLIKNQQILENPPFVCDGRKITNLIQISNGRIALYGIGFFGPVIADAHYDVTIDIKIYISPSPFSLNGKLEKRLFARKQEIFHFMFDTPVVLEPMEDESEWNFDEKYIIYFTLKGPDTMAVKRKVGFEGPVEEEGIKFRFFWDNGRNQFAEFLYKKL